MFHKAWQDSELPFNAVLLPPCVCVFGSSFNISTNTSIFTKFGDCQCRIKPRRLHAVKMIATGGQTPEVGQPMLLNTGFMAAP
jgi:hypothetical protein